MRDTDEDWNRIAQREPYFGVLTNERFLRSRFDKASETEFFAAGEADIAYCYGVLSNMGGDFRPKSGLDFGCGVGRLLAPMCRRVQIAYGVDVASEMRRLAEKHLRTMGLSNFKLSAEISERQVDWVNSALVLQHIPPNRGYGIIRTLWRTLCPGGWFSLHLTIYRDRRHMHEILSDVVTFGYNGNTAEIFEGNAASDPGSMRMYDYNLSRVLATLALRDGHRVIAEHLDHNGCHAVRLFIIK